MTQRLLLMRHGQTEASIRGIYSSGAGLPLTTEGRAQADRAAEGLRGSGVDAIRSSPFDRARDTAEAVARGIELPVVLDERLREIDYGPFEGLSRAQAERRFSVYMSWREHPFEAHPAGMEALEDALARVRAAVEDALAGSRCPLLVAHQGSLRLVLIAVGQIRRDQYFETLIPEAEPLEVDRPHIDV